MTLSLAHRRAILTWRSAEVVNLYLFSLQIYACSNIFLEQCPCNNSFNMYNLSIFLSNLRTYALKPSLCCVHVHVYILPFTSLNYISVYSMFVGTDTNSSDIHFLIFYFSLSFSQYKYNFHVPVHPV